MVPLTRHGWRELLIGTVVLAVIGSALGYAWWPLALVVIPVFIWLVAFFRDPERVIPDQQHIMVSPADGVVSDITEIDNDPLVNGPALRIGIFLSVFNVHINRSPCDGRVLSVTYKKGKFINAMNHAAASDDNESNTIVLAEPGGDRPVAVVKQIVGLIARRIVSTSSVNDTVVRGQRIGMIKFGSRTELTIPRRLGPKAAVNVGQKVRGGADVVATLEHGLAGIAAESTEAEPLVGRETPA